MKVTAILVSWKRPKELAQIIENLYQYEFIDEIIVAINRPDDNLKCYRRWLAVKEARNNTIYVQDDDCIIGNLRELYENYTGTRMVIGMKETRIVEYIGEKSAMVGWGTFFDKNWVNFNKYLDTYGVDDLLIRESDRIITYKIGKERPHKYKIADVKDFDCANSDDAMWVQPNHWDYKKIAIQTAREIYD